MAEGLNCCGILTKVILILINIFYLIIGLLLTGVAVYTFINLMEDTTTASAVVLIVGVVTMLTAIMGIVGAAAHLWPLLIVYSVFLFALIALQITAGIIAFISINKIEGAVGKVLKECIQNYTTADSVNYNERCNNLIDFVQETFHCCGLIQPGDWLYLNPNYITTNGPPASCTCESATETITDSTNSQCLYLSSVLFQHNINIPGTNVYVWKRGCKGAFSDFLKKYAIALGSISASFGLIQLLTLIMTIGLILCIVVSNKRRRRAAHIQNVAYMPLDSYPSNTIVNNSSNTIVNSSSNTIVNNYKENEYTPANATIQ